MKKVLILLFIFVMSLSILGCGSDTPKETSSSSTTTSSTTTSSTTEKNSTEKNSTDEIKWNKTVLDATKNGNMPIAVKLVVEDNNLSAKAEDANPADVMRRPFDYYGKVIAFTGEAYYLQDYPPESDFGKAFGGNVCEVVMMSGETIVDVIGQGTTTGIEKGQIVTLYGYPVGVTNVPNKVGGSFDQLIVIGVVGQ